MRRALPFAQHDCEVVEAQALIWHTQIRIAFIGAGGINFGSPEGPWNHSSRLQLLPDVTFSAIVDPNNKLAQERIDTLQKGDRA